MLCGFFAGENKKGNLIYCENYRVSVLTSNL